MSHEWSTKYKCIGPTSRPNYVLVGDESSSNYLEGFSLDFNATAACHKMDFRQNMLFYDLSNDVIVDKTGHGVNTTTLPACSPNDQPRLWLATSWSADQGFNQHRDQLAPSSLKLCDFESEIHNEIHNEIFTEIVTEI